MDNSACLMIGLGAVVLLSSCQGKRVDLSAGLPPAPEGQRWELIPQLSDEFAGGNLDASKWQPRHPFWKGREPSQFAPENVKVRDGMLELRSTSLVDRLEQVKDPQKDIWILAACVSSLKPIAGPGYYEARIKASRLSMTSSFWMQGKYSEIDIVEQKGASIKHPEDAQYMLMNTHYFAAGWEKDKATPARWKMPVGAADDFHVYGAWWKDRDTVWFYHNGTKVAEVKTGGAFLEPMFLTFDTEAWAALNELPTIRSLRDANGSIMIVDWVRAWHLVGTDKLPQGR